MHALQGFRRLLDHLSHDTLTLSLASVFFGDVMERTVSYNVGKDHRFCQFLQVKKMHYFCLPNASVGAD